MTQISRRNFITALFGTAAALAIAKLPVLETIPEVIKLPTTAKPFAHRQIFEFTMHGDVGGMCHIGRFGDPPVVAGGFADDGMLLLRLPPCDPVILLPEHLLEVDYVPFRAAATPMRFQFIGRDIDGRGWIRDFIETFTVSGDSSRLIASDGGIPLHLEKWRDPSKIVASRDVDLTTDDREYDDD